MTDTIDFDPDIFLDWSGDSSYIYTHTLSLALGESLTDAILFITFQDDGDCAGEEVSLILNGRSAWHSHPVYSDTYSGNVFRYLEDNSLVVNTSNEDEMTAALQRLIEDDVLRTHCQQRGIETAENYSIERAVLSELSLFRLAQVEKSLGV